LRPASAGTNGPFRFPVPACSIAIWLIGENIREARDIRKSRMETKKVCRCFVLNTKTLGTRALLGAMLNRRRTTKYRSSERMSRLRLQGNPNGLELLQL